MIGRLIRRDPAWQWLPPTVIGFCALVPFDHFLAMSNSHPGTTHLGVSFAFLLFVIGMATASQQSETNFQSILPVTVQQVFAARMISVTVLSWLPVVAGATILAALGDSAVSDLPWGIWSVVTCILLGVQCAVIRGFRVRTSLLAIALPVWFVISEMHESFDVDWTFRNSFAGNLAFACCWLVAAALIVRTWRVVPSCFQLAPAGSAITGSVPIAADPASTRGAPWKPVLRTMFPLMGTEYLFNFLAMCFMHSPLLFFLLLGSGQSWTSARMRLRWMLALPVPRRALLAVVTLPGMLSMIAGYLVGVHLSFIPGQNAETALRTQFVTVVIIAGWSMLANLFGLAGDWYPLRRVLPSGHWSAVFTISFVGVGLVLMIRHITANFDSALEPVRWLSSAFPVSLGGMIAVSVVVLGVLLWALDAVFRQVELADKVITGERL